MTFSLLKVMATMEAVSCALFKGLVIMKLNLTSISLSDFAISTTSHLPSIVSGLSKSLLLGEIRLPASPWRRMNMSIFKGQCAN